MISSHDPCSKHPHVQRDGHSRVHNLQRFPKNPNRRGLLLCAVLVCHLPEQTTQTKQTGLQRRTHPWLNKNKPSSCRKDPWWICFMMLSKDIQINLWGIILDKQKHGFCFLKLKRKLIKRLCFINNGAFFFSASCCVGKSVVHCCN